MMPRRPHDPTTIDVTVVLPAHNEEGNILPLMEQFGELARKARFSLEVVLVDDGSNDQTLPRAVEAQNHHRFLRIVSLPHRRGLTEALRAGFSVARGQIIVFYPADRQFHPADIPRMVEKVRSGYDLVTGRKIGFYNKKFVSSFYNRLSRWLFPSIKVTDLNSVKAFRRELVNVFDYRHDWHRFWVAIAAEAGYNIGEVDVTLYQRSAGRSKFGFWRIPGGVLDLLAVKFQYHTMRRPLWYFGMTGIFLLVAAFVLGGVALYQRFVEGHGYRPFVYLVMSLGLAGVVFFAIGFLAEAVASLRQQLDTLRPAPKYHVYKSGANERPVPSRSAGDSPEPRSDRREGGDRRRDQSRGNRPGRGPGRRRDENRRGEQPSRPIPPPVESSVSSTSELEAPAETQPSFAEVERFAPALDEGEARGFEPAIPSTPDEADAAPSAPPPTERSDTPTPLAPPRVNQYGRRRRG
jgi:glycosyltransferase involved in cell wall biosynthesis